MSLKLKKLVIHEGCSYLKRLQPNTYEFLDNGSIDNFYGEGIEVSAVVGKNGCGKSSLLEIIFRMINNLSVFIAYKVDVMHRVNSVFVAGLNSDLYYTINDVECQLICRNHSLAFIYGENRWAFGNHNDEFNGFKDGNTMSKTKKIAMCKNVFFTLISNYSVQAYVDEDYQDDITCTIDEDGHVLEVPSEEAWIHYVFHKNDGYMAAININPFRDKGKLDMQREERLERQRMQFLLLHYHKKNREFIQGYKLSSIKYKFNWKKLYYKFTHSKVETLTEEVQEGEWEEIKAKFRDALEMDRSIAKSILHEVVGTDVRLNDDMLFYAYMYIVYKILSIACTYPSYSQYEPIANIDNAFESGTHEQRVYALNLTKDVLADHSHITNKVYQASNFIKMVIAGFRSNVNDGFTWNDYDHHKINDELNSSSAIENEIRCLPPSFFDFKIYLSQNGQVGELPIEHMSAGERQLYYILSTLIYHILNIKSVDARRIHYRDLAIVLDEVELGFHPDFQRKFINFLIETFTRLRLNTYLRFHFIITTHSPFMLSDVRKNNILYLEEGHKKDKVELMDPFGANINEILAQSFFLDDGFVGDFARHKILDLLNWLDVKKSNNSVWDIDKAQAVVDSLGEPIIRDHLKHMVEHKRRMLNAQDINN